MIDNRTQVFDVAMKNARTIEACLNRLAMMGADHQLKLIAGRLSRLTQCAERRSPVEKTSGADSFWRTRFIPKHKSGKARIA
jgi:hypothetical protein